MLVRNPDLLIFWQDGRILVREPESGKGVLSSEELIRVLDQFTLPRRIGDVVAGFRSRDPKALRRLIRRLRDLKLLLPVQQLQRRRARIEAWNHNFASLHYHLATRDMRYLIDPEGTDAFLRLRLASGSRPPVFKVYPSLPLRPLARNAPRAAPARLRRILRARRTVREFLEEAVPLEAFSESVRGTWGRTGWLDGAVLGPLPTKTSPSAGCLHPGECYVLVWNVRGLAPGLYHYDVPADSLRLLRRGDFRKAAVRAASDQPWVGQAAFLCVMTAVYARTLWKYERETAYRLVWMEAGHLAQTFCLLATSLGLGPFTTAAIQDSYIEKLIGLDGINEFPVYLCGAGVPAKKLL